MPGLYFEEFSVGQIFDHPIRRTVTEADNVFFTAMTHNPAQLHLDEEYAQGHRVRHSASSIRCYTLGLMIGISVGDTTLGTTVANLGMDEVRFPKPVFHGDTLHVETEVLELRESKSRPANGIVIFLHRAINQRDEIVAQCKRSALMLKKTVVVMILRSLLFVPADSEKKLAKSKSSPADALILDLEDSVAAANRPAARKLAADYVRNAQRQGPGAVRAHQSDRHRRLRSRSRCHCRGRARRPCRAQAGFARRAGRAGPHDRRARGRAWPAARRHQGVAGGDAKRPPPCST